jgi:tRNA (uracil-5-)-methyltransferase
MMDEIKVEAQSVADNHNQQEVDNDQDSYSKRDEFSLERVKVEIKVEPESVADNHNQQEVDNDQDSYLKRDEFSSERFKVEIKNLPKYFGFAQLKKYLTSLKLSFVKISSPQKSSYAFVTFPSEESKQEAIEILNKSTFKGHKLSAIHANPAPDPRKAIENNNEIRKRSKA